MVLSKVLTINPSTPKAFLSISIPDDSKVNINLSFTKEKFLNLSVNINIGALLNYEGAKVEFNYNLNGVLKYDNLTPGLDEFKKGEKFIKYDEANIDYDKFINDSVDNVKFIYEQIIALF